MKIENKRALFDYEILDHLEAGMVLSGHDARSIRENRVNLSNSYVKFIDGELYLVNAHLGATEVGSTLATRSRKLLVSKKEMISLETKLRQGTLTIVPISIYNKGRYYKIDIGLAKGRKQAGKRELLKKRDITRDVERELRGVKDEDSRR